MKFYQKLKIHNKSEVFRWDSEYGVTNISFIKKVSDHYPVYAEFRTNLIDDDQGIWKIIKTWGNRLEVIVSGKGKKESKEKG